MFGEWLSDIRKYFLHRLRNPILAPFSVAWIVSNWRLVFFLLFSEKGIEEKITYVEETYLDVLHLLIYPLVFALFYALVLPWVHLIIEWIQDKANLKRRKHGLSSETEYLKASVERAEAEANLNRILAQDEITRRQQEELERLRQQAEQSDSAAQAQIQAIEAEYQAKLQEYKSSREADNEKTEAQRKQLDSLHNELKYQRQKAEEEQQRAQLSLREKEKDLEARLASIQAVPSASTGVDFKQLLVNRPYRLFHNPKVGPERSKLITFESDGEIGKGRNKNESSWRLANGMLELLQADGDVHSRFYYLPPSRIFVHTGDKDTRSARGQYIVPELPSNSE